MNEARNHAPRVRPLFRTPTRFQLTPLMDLLLIIVFAQFLDVREVAENQANEFQDRRSELTRQLDEAIADRESLSQRTDVAMKALSELFAVQPTDSSLDQAIEQSRELSQAGPAKMLRFLVGHAELLKRAEIWTLHASDVGDIRLTAGKRRQSFRLERTTQDARTREVAEALFTAYKQLPEPKGLVIILVSYDLKSVAGVYQPLVDAIPGALERLRADTPETRFEYTVLGATPDPEESSMRGDPDA